MKALLVQRLCSNIHSSFIHNSQEPGKKYKWPPPGERIIELQDIHMRGSAMEQNELLIHTTTHVDPKMIILTEARQKRERINRG